MAILNLTQHATTEPQIADGVVDLTPEDNAKLKQIITFEEETNQ
jgi:cell wall assembly regulator SMI1